MSEKRLYVFGLLVVFCVSVAFVQAGFAEPYKVLSIMSYHEDFFWSKDMKKGIDSVLKNKCEITYFYLDTWRSKNNLEKGKEKAKEAYALYQKLQPDGIIASDDNAQSMFVLPYLKGKTNIPIIFCGVNERLEKYGYPTPNITGVKEINHFRESIAFLQQLVPSVKTIGYLMRKCPTAKGYVQQLNRESDTYPAKTVAIELVHTLKEAKSVAKELKNRCDALFVEIIEGITDDNGIPVTKKSDIIPVINKIFGKPTFCSNDKTVKAGALCAVAKLPSEQGSLAAQMLMKALTGTPVSEIPVTQNKRGKAIINVTTMKALGIKPQPKVLIGVELVKTEN